MRHRHPVTNLILSVLFMLAAALVAGGIAAAAGGCGPVREQSSAVAGDVVDCTTVTAKKHAAEYGALLEAALRAATSPDGRVDWAAIRAAAASFSAETGGCALAAVIQRLLAPPAPTAPAAFAQLPPPLDAAALRDGFAELERELWGGRKFRTELGML